MTISLFFAVLLQVHLQAVDVAPETSVAMQSAVTQQTHEETFSQAIEWYREGEIVQSYEALFQIVLEGGQAPELFFNLGVASSRLGRKGEAMGWFQLASEHPRLETEAQEAFTSVQNQLPFTIPVLPKTPWQQGFESLQGLFTPNGWSWVLSLAFYLVALGFGLRWFTSLPTRLTIILSSMGALGAVISAGLLWTSSIHYNETVVGYITTDSITLYNEPTNENPSETMAYEGVRVQVRMNELQAFPSTMPEDKQRSGDSNLGEWLPVTLSNGSSGWLPTKDVFLADTRYLGLSR
jgi:hypothetical protein